MREYNRLSSALMLWLKSSPIRNTSIVKVDLAFTNHLMSTAGGKPYTDNTSAYSMFGRHHLTYEEHWDTEETENNKLRHTIAGSQQRCQRPNFFFKEKTRLKSGIPLFLNSRLASTFMTINLHRFGLALL